MRIPVILKNIFRILIIQDWDIFAGLMGWHSKSCGTSHIFERLLIIKSSSAINQEEFSILL